MLLFDGALVSKSTGGRWSFPPPRVVCAAVGEAEENDVYSSVVASMFLI